MSRNNETGWWGRRSLLGKIGIIAGSVVAGIFVLVIVLGLVAGPMSDAETVRSSTPVSETEYKVAPTATRTSELARYTRIQYEAWWQNTEVGELMNHLAILMLHPQPTDPAWREELDLIGFRLETVAIEAQGVRPPVAFADLHVKVLGATGHWAHVGRMLQDWNASGATRFSDEWIAEVERHLAQGSALLEQAVQ